MTDVKNHKTEGYIKMTEKITESWKNILKWIEISNHHGLGA
jgi:hypothetical protein